MLPLTAREGRASFSHYLKSPALKLEITANFHNSMCAKSLSSAKYVLKGPAVLDAQHYKCEVFAPPTMDRYSQSSTLKVCAVPAGVQSLQKLISLQVW